MKKIPLYTLIFSLVFGLLSVHTAQADSKTSSKRAAQGVLKAMKKQKEQKEKISQDLAEIGSEDSDYSAQLQRSDKKQKTFTIIQKVPSFIEIQEQKDLVLRYDLRDLMKKNIDAIIAVWEASQKNDDENDETCPLNPVSADIIGDGYSWGVDYRDYTDWEELWAWADYCRPTEYSKTVNFEISNIEDIHMEGDAASGIVCPEGNFDINSGEGDTCGNIAYSGSYHTKYTYNPNVIYGCRICGTRVDNGEEYCSAIHLYPNHTPGYHVAWCQGKTIKW